MDPTLANAEPLSNGHSTSGITYSEKGKIKLHRGILQQERVVR